MKDLDWSDVERDAQRMNDLLGLEDKAPAEDDEEEDDDGVTCDCH